MIVEKAYVLAAFMRAFFGFQEIQHPDVAEVIGRLSTQYFERNVALELCISSQPNGRRAWAGDVSNPPLSRWIGSSICYRIVLKLLDASKTIMVCSGIYLPPWPSLCTIRYLPSVKLSPKRTG